MNNKLLSFYFLVLLLYSAQPCNYLAISENAPNILFAAFPFLLSLFVMIKQRIEFFSKKLIAMYVVLTVWNVLQYEIYHVNPSPYPYMCLYCGYVGFSVFRNDFFDRFIDSVTKLSILSLLVYAITIVATSSVISFSNRFGIDSTVSNSFILVNIGKNLTGGFPRNPGFCWEPGRFSCFLFFAIAMVLLRDGLDFKSRKFQVLLIALISTFSTTGFGALIFLLLYWALKGRSFNPIYLAFALLVVAGLWTLPFMRDKVTKLWMTQDDVDVAISQMTWVLQNGGGDEYYAPQRFQGLMFQWINFQNMPLLLGASRNTNLHYLNNVMGFKLALSEGNLGVIVKYGFILGILLYYLLIRSSRYLSQLFNRKMPFLILGLFMVANFSYYFWETPIFIIMWAWAYYSDTDKNNPVAYLLNK